MQNLRKNLSCFTRFNESYCTSIWCCSVLGLWASVCLQFARRNVQTPWLPLLVTFVPWQSRQLWCGHVRCVLMALCKDVGYLWMFIHINTCIWKIVQVHILMVHLRLYLSGNFIYFLGISDLASLRCRPNGPHAGESGEMCLFRGRS